MIRPSSAPRAVNCMHWVHHEPVDYDYVSPGKEGPTRKEKAARGTLTHLLFSSRRIAARPAAPYDTLPREVPVAFDITGKSRQLVLPKPIHHAFELFMDDVRRLNPDHIIGHSDMLGIVDGVLYVCDLKTGDVKPEAFYQLAMYGVLWCMQHNRQDLIPGMQLAIWRLRYRGADNLIQTTQIETVNSMVYPAHPVAGIVQKVKELLIDLAMPPARWPATPGPHCVFCPARFTCSEYGKGLDKVYPSIRQWMINEMLDYQEKLIDKGASDE
jgi:hypothetical protein